MDMHSRSRLSVAMLLFLAVPAVAEETAWEAVQRILSTTHDVVVLDGTEQGPIVSGETNTPEVGDWWVGHLPFDPLTLNPYTATDVISFRVIQPIIEPLLELDRDPPYGFRGLLAKEPPEVSPDKLRYTFSLRPEVRFSDGQALTAEDLLFTMKVIMNHRVVPSLFRGFMVGLKDVRVLDKQRIAFEYSEPYVLNEYYLGLFVAPLARHFYDPEGLLDPVEIRTLIDGSWEKGPYAKQVERFAEQYMQNFSRRILGTGPYTLKDPEKDLVTQQKVVLTRNPAYWGKGVDGVWQKGYFEKLVFKIINNADAAFIELKNGTLDTYALLPLQFKEQCWSSGFTADYWIGVEYLDAFQFIDLTKPSALLIESVSYASRWVMILR